MQVAEVAPARVGLAAFDGRHQLLRHDHAERVAEQADRPAEQPGELDHARPGVDRVAQVDVDVEGQLRPLEHARHGHPDPAVLGVVADRRGGRCVAVEQQSVVDGDGGDALHGDQHVVGRAAQADGGDVDVAGRPAGVERGQQHAALEDERPGVRRPRQPVEEALECIELEQCAGVAAARLGVPAQVQVDAAADGVAGRAPGLGHSRTSRAWRSGATAPGKWPASSSSRAGREPRRPDQRRSAS